MGRLLWRIPSTCRFLLSALFADRHAAFRTVNHRRAVGSLFPNLLLPKQAGDLFYGLLSTLTCRLLLLLLPLLKYNNTPADMCLP